MAYYTQRTRMNQEPPLDIALLKERLFELQRLYESHQQLLSLREELDRQIEKLKKEKPLLLHRSASIERRSQQIQEKETLIRQLKQKRQQVDRLLDQSEEITEEDLEKNREYLIQAILYFHPEEREEEESRNVQFLQMSGMEKKIIFLLPPLVELRERLTHALQIRHSIRGRGLLQYIVGISPNLLIEKDFKEGERLLQALLPHLQDDLKEVDDLEMKNLYQQLIRLGERLLHELRMRWGFRHLDTFFKRSHEEISLYTLQMEEKLSAVQEKKKRLEQQMKDWLERF